MEDALTFEEASYQLNCLKTDIKISYHWDSNSFITEEKYAFVENRGGEFLNKIIPQVHKRWGAKFATFVTHNVWEKDLFRSERVLNDSRRRSHF